MKFTTPLVLLASLGLASAHPTVELTKRDDPQAVNLVFHGGPAEYSLSFTANGAFNPTNNDIAVSIIDFPDYLPRFCQIQFKDGATPALQETANTQTGLQSMIVGPPTPVVGVSCEGFCLPVYGMCYGFDGQYVGPCCNGFCAATRCRPWIVPN